jgi:polypeptide N-acetylgalactosaminyltransferase
MCGGSLEIHPCSAVGHIFRRTSPYKWGKTFFEILRHNYVRVPKIHLPNDVRAKNTSTE